MNNRESYSDDIHEMVKKLGEEVNIKPTESHIVSSDVLRNQ